MLIVIFSSPFLIPHAQKQQWLKTIAGLEPLLVLPA
jgi:hypothetical protein